MSIDVNPLGGESSVKGRERHELERALAQVGFGGAGARRAREAADGHAGVSVSREAEGSAAKSEARGIAAGEFDEIVRENQRKIFRILMAMVRDEDAADTLTQECFLRAYRKRESFRGEASVGTWLVRIAVNLARDHQRSKRVAFWKRLFARGVERESDDGAWNERRAERIEDPARSVEEGLIARERASAAWRAALELPPQQRAILVLRFAEEMKLEEIAGALGVKTGTAKVHLHRAISALRKRLGEPAQRRKEP